VAYVPPLSLSKKTSVIYLFLQPGWSKKLLQGLDYRAKGEYGNYTDGIRTSSRRRGAERAQEASSKSSLRSITLYYLSFSYQKKADSLF
jgi:hypothetical protein